MERLKLDLRKRYQRFEGFGASGAWWAQVIGGWTETDPDSGLPKRERISQLLFDKEKGIGIGCFRYNLGAGSAESGKGRFDPECRRAECFYNDRNEYDWSKDKNAVWVMKQAVKDGANEVILFVNSPPERFTKNGKAHLDRAWRTNLKPANYQPFADYCLDCAEHFLAEGLPVRYLSPVNEPVWKWTGGQEGCHYRPRQVRRLMHVFAEEMSRRPALAKLKLSGAENGDIRWFNKTYCRIMLGDKRIAERTDGIDVHSYFLTPRIPVIAGLIDERLVFLRRFRKYMDRRFPGAPVKVSEWTHMKGGRDYGMDSALEQTKVIIEDLTVLNASAWQLWIAVSNVDYCDGLIYESDDTRTFELTKRYFAFGNFTKFIEPGSLRFEVSAGDKLKAVGFAKNNRHVIVAANFSDSAAELELPEGIEEVYVTDAEHDLTPFAPERSFRFPAKSVVTFVANAL